MSLIVLGISGCAGMMPPVYAPPTSGPTAVVTFSGLGRIYGEKTSSTFLNPSAALEYDIFTCKVVSMKNFYGYLIVTSENPITTEVVANKPLLIRSGADTNVVAGYIFFSFVPEENESYFVGSTIHEKDSFLSKKLSYSVYVEKMDRATGKMRKLPIKISEAGSGLRKTIADWPECE